MKSSIFDTLTKEILADLNSRLLIQIDSAFEDEIEPLTPRHFIAIKLLVPLPDNLPVKDIACNKRWSSPKALQGLLEALVLRIHTDSQPLCQVV